MEEIPNSTTNKINIIKKFNAKKLLSVCQFCFKKLYYEQIILKKENEGLFDNFLSFDTV